MAQSQSPHLGCADSNSYFSVVCKPPVCLGAKSLQSCPTLCNPIDGSPPGSPHPWDSPGKNTGVGCHFLLQCMKVKSQSKVAQCVRLLATSWTAAHQAPPSMGFSRQEYWSEVPLPSPLYALGRDKFTSLPQSKQNQNKHSPAWVHPSCASHQLYGL